ncbi:MAG: outer membrane lipoprotein-sorting protein [Acidobacteriota bacterium]
MRFAKIVALLCVASVLCLPVFGQTVDEILAKNFAARGGLEKIKAIQSYKMTGKMSVQGMELPFTLTSARPDLMRMDMSLQGKSMVQAYDGETAWMINPMAGGDPEKMPEDQTKSFKEQGEFDGPLVDYKTKGHTVELLGKEEIEGTEAYKLKVTRSGGDVRTYYIDAKTFLELKSAGRQKMQGTDMEMETFFSDYKPVNGVLMAHSMESKVKGQRFMIMTLESVEANVAVDAASFKMPKKP